MCYNVINGRYHTRCNHFIAMSTRLQDCFSQTCHFSSRHPVGCKSPKCQKLMTAPQRNPIRIAETWCQDCIMRGEEGIIQGQPQYAQ